MSVAKTLQEELLKAKAERERNTREKRDTDSDMSDRRRARSRDRMSRDRSRDRSRERVSRDRSRDRSRERMSRDRSRDRDRHRGSRDGDDIHRERDRREREDAMKRHGYVTNNTNSSDPALLNSRVFIGNLPTDKIARTDLEDVFRKYGRILAISLLQGYGFIQYEREEDARIAVDSEQGGILKGSKLDVKMAAEGRKQTRPNSRRSPPPRREKSLERDRDRDRSRDRSRDRDRDRERDRDRDRARGRDRSRERREDDRYGRPLPPLRDPYDRYGDPYARRPSRDLPPLPGDYLPPPPHGLDPAPFRPPFECEIVMTNPQLRGYADSIERQLKHTGMLVQHNVLKSDAEIPKAIEDLARLKVPYAVVIIEQNEIHRSITLNILHGTTQEHRNMPLEDALKLMATNFEGYVRDIRDKATAPPPPPPAPPAPAPPPPAPAPRRDMPEFVPPDQHTHYLLNLLADNRILTLEELDHVIGYLEKRRQVLLDSRPALAARPKMHPSMADKIELPPRDVDMMNRMGVNPADVPSRMPRASYSPPPPVPPVSSSAASINFSNPSVQKALDDLMQRGPNLLSGIAGGNGSNARGPGPQGFGHPMDHPMDDYDNHMDSYRSAGPHNY